MTDLIAEFVRHLRDEGYARSTAELYEATLRRMNRQLPMGLYSANTDEIKAWINGGDGRRVNRTERSAGTRATFGAIARAFFAWATDPGDDRGPYLDYDPAAHLRKVRVRRGTPRPIPAEQYADILTRAREPYRTWFQIAALTGARCVELAELDRDDVTERDTLLHGKGSKDRLVPTHEAVWALAQSAPPGLLVVGAHGEALTRKQVSQRGNRVMQYVLGHRDVTMHRWRHTFLTSVYDECQDLLAAKELAGHASVATTQIYVRPQDRAMRRAVDALRAA